MHNKDKILDYFRIKKVKTKIIILFVFIALISGVIASYSIYQIEVIDEKVSVMESNLDDIKSGITTISTLGLNISDVHAKIGVLINKMHHSLHVYGEGEIDGIEAFALYKNNFSDLINKLDNEISNDYGSIKVDIAHIKSNFNQYVSTIENDKNSGIFSKMAQLNELKNQFNYELNNNASLESILNLNQQISNQEKIIEESFDQIVIYEKKIEQQLDSLIDNLYFEIETININAQESNLAAIKTHQEIVSLTEIYKLSMIWSSVFLFIIAGIIGYYYSNRITSALQKLTNVSKKIQKGNFPNKPINVKSNDEFLILANTFNSMTSSIEQLIKQKNEFIHRLGHDLKNPLGPMINLLPILDKHCENDKDKEIIKVLKRNVSYMKDLVQKTLKLAQLNNPNIELSKDKINLSKFVDNIVKNNQYLIESKNNLVKNEIPSEIYIEADKLQMEELFTNLLNNAVKYNKINGNILLKARKNEDLITVSIQDFGIGMNPDESKYIFDEFYKADKSRHDFESSGLGMPISKRIIEHHGGKIWVESPGKGKGSTFYFTIPFDIEEDSIEKNTKQKENDHSSISEKVDELLLRQ